MQIALIGYGKTGKVVQEVAVQRGHEITTIFRDSDSINKAPLSANVAIDFTSPQAFKKNYKILADKFAAVIVGTTGWEDIQKEVFDYFSAKNKTLIYASNFSLGMNAFFHIVETTSKLLVNYDYDPFLIELHHRNKKDAPSGTARTIDKIIKNVFGKSANPVSVRSGQIKGIHEVGYESAVDRIILKHEAYSQRGFAEGAVSAAEWSNSVTGIWNFRDLLNKKFIEKLSS